MRNFENQKCIPIQRVYKHLLSPLFKHNEVFLNICTRVLLRYKNMGTSSGAYELNHECASRTKTHDLLTR